VRTLAAALEMIDAGATRIGATATAAMCDDLRKLKESGANGVSR
jgi:deoxyribose-phosphate aldolase